MHKNPFCILLILLIPWVSYSQSPIVKKAKKQLSAIFEEDKPRTQVLLLGIFHFAGEQVDVNTTPVNLRINMLSTERQQQIERLVKKLAAFNPTKIIIEAPPNSQHYYDSLYREYKQGKQLLGKNIKPAEETFQIAFRLANSLSLKTVYPVDAQPFRFNLSEADSVVTYEKYKDQSDSSFTHWDLPYDREKEHQDSLAFFLPLNQYLQYLNAPEKQAKTIGRWLITTKRGTNQEPIGADGFITRYFNRNVRIYSNIQRIVTSKSDRILVIYGATHLYLLKTLFAASPEFELKDIMEYLN